MVLLLATAAILSGLNILLLKVADSMLQTGDWRDYIGLCVFLLLLMVFFADAMLQFLNMGIKLYDQLECIPIYQIMILISWEAVGLFVFEETNLNSGPQLFGIFVGALFAVIGVGVLYKKRLTVLSDQYKKDRLMRKA